MTNQQHTLDFLSYDYRKNKIILWLLLFGSLPVAAFNISLPVESFKSRWGAVGLGVLAIIFGSIAVAAPVSTAVFVIFMLGFGLLFLGISHVVYGIGSSESRGWARGFSIGAGALSIAISFLVMASPFAGAVFVSIFLGIALLIIGIEIIAVGATGRRMPMMPSMGR